MRSIHRFCFRTACVVALGIFTNACDAHFLWLKTIEQDGRPQAFLFFGENVADEAYHLPESLADIDVWRRTAEGKREKLTTKPLDTDDRVGLVAPIDTQEPCVLEATQQYGIYHDALLVYYTKHVHANSSEQLNAAGPSKELKLDIVPRAEGEKLTLTVLREGKPLEGAETTVVVGDEEPIEKATDEDGRIVVEQDGKQLVSVLTHFVDKTAKGDLDGKPYSGVMHYASLTLNQDNSPKTASVSPPASKQQSQAELPPLPEPVSSFGAAISDGWLYVYSGHTGDEHEHSTANLSKHFRRLNLDDSAGWEDLQIEMPLQGLGLVAHGGKIYRIGGLNARNATTKDKEDLHSTAEFSEYDPASRKWIALAPLPAPRSSHNAVVIGDRLYVVGGWQLQGKSPGEWQPDALVFDFTDQQAGWQKLPVPPFKRRALAIGTWQGKLVAIGGMDEKARVSRRVDVFDFKTNEWTLGPKLPGAGMAGFGGSACEQDGELYASGLRGIVYRLSDAGSAWEEVARLDKPRFFHQLLPAGDGRLVAVGGASREGHLADLESVNVRNNPSTAAVSKLSR